MAKSYLAEKINASSFSILVLLGIFSKLGYLSYSENVKELVFNCLKGKKLTQKEEQKILEEMRTIEKAYNDPSMKASEKNGIINICQDTIVDVIGLKRQN